MVIHSVSVNRNHQVDHTRLAHNQHPRLGAPTDSARAVLHPWVIRRVSSSFTF